jgi:hypothetical protein
VLFYLCINHLGILGDGSAAELTGEPAEEFAGEFAAEQRNSSGTRHRYARGGAHRVEIPLRGGGREAELLGARHGGDDRLGELDPPAIVGEEGGALGKTLLRGCR